jgi:hypothetical protein
MESNLDRKNDLPLNQKKIKHITTPSLKNHRTRYFTEGILGCNIITYEILVISISLNTLLIEILNVITLRLTIPLVKYLLL